MRIVPFEPWHLLKIAVQPQQRLTDAALRSPQNAEDLAKAGPCFTLLDGEAPLAIAGVVDRTPGRGIAWAVFSTTAIAHFGMVHRAVKRFLELGHYRRIEMMVDPRHVGAGKWARRLGFVREGLCQSYAPDGSDFELWARVKDGRGSRSSDRLRI